VGVTENDFIFFPHFLKNKYRKPEFSKIYHRYHLERWLGLTAIGNVGCFHPLFEIAVGAQDKRVGAWADGRKQPPLPTAAEPFH
jgi:hypothetical protein